MRRILVASLVTIFVGLSLTTLAQTTTDTATDASTNTATATDTAGQVVYATGTLEAKNSNQETRSLDRASTFSQDDTIYSGTHTLAQLRFTDGTLLAMRPSSIVEVKQYYFAPSEDSSKQNFSVDIVDGGLRTVTGEIAKVNPQNYQISSSVAVMGVRGTDFSLAYAPEKQGGLYEAIHHGIISITNNTGTVTLDSKSPYHYAYVASMDSKPVLLKTRPAIFKNDISIQPVTAAVKTAKAKPQAKAKTLVKAKPKAKPAAKKNTAPVKGKGKSAAAGKTSIVATTGIGTTVQTTTVPGVGTSVHTSRVVGKSVETTTAAGVKTTNTNSIMRSSSSMYRPAKLQFAALRSNFYVGGGFGGDFLTFSGSSTNRFSTGTAAANSFSDVISPGAAVRLSAGYEYINNNFSLGAEIFGFYSSAESDAKLGQVNAATCDFHVHSKDTIGIVIVPGHIFSKGNHNILGYAHIGWVNTEYNVDASTNNVFDTVQVLPFSSSQRLNGLDLGLGAEFPIDQHLAARIGYDFMRYSTLNKQIGPTVIATAPTITKVSTFSLRPTDNQINFSLIYHV
jgi:hypothetical protein